MPRSTRGSIYKTKSGVGIRWQHAGERGHKSGFKTRTEAREWFDKHIKPRLKRGTSSAQITFAEFVEVYVERWSPGKAPRTVDTLRAWLVPAIRTFGSYRLAELEGAAEDVARWRASLDGDDRRFKATRALRQVLAAAVRWDYLTRNAALDFGGNPEPRREEIRPLSSEEVDRIVGEIAPQDAAIVIFAIETGLRTNEWLALERKDIDRQNPAVMVARRYSGGRLVPYPKTGRRRVPLTPTALGALEWIPPRLDTSILFAGEHGGYLNLNNWRNRVWYPALEAAGVKSCGPYCLRHTFASEALRAGVSIWQLARLMGASVRTIERHYGHLTQDSEEHLRGLLAARTGVVDATDEEPLQNE